MGQCCELAAFLQLQQPGKEGVGTGSSFKDKQSRGFGTAACCFLSTRICSAAGGCGTGLCLCLEWGRALEHRVSLLISPCSTAVASPNFPPPWQGAEARLCQGEKQKWKGSWHRGAARFREGTGPCYFLCLAGFDWIFDLRTVAVCVSRRDSCSSVKPSTALTPRSFVAADGVKNLRAGLSQMGTLECQKDSLLQHILSCPKLSGCTALCAFVSSVSSVSLTVCWSLCPFYIAWCRFCLLCVHWEEDLQKMPNSKQQWHGGKGLLS